jgi:hypothetical protein
MNLMTELHDINEVMIPDGSQMLDVSQMTILRDGVTPKLKRAELLCSLHPSICYPLVMSK